MSGRLPPRGQMATFLLITTGTRAGHLTVEKELELGRDVPGKGLLADDEMRSRCHACARRNHDGTLIVTDLSSGNGTFINSTRVTEARRLAYGDVLELGKTKLEVGTSRRASRLGPRRWNRWERARWFASWRKRLRRLRSQPLFQRRRFEISPTRLTIGRQPDNATIGDMPNDVLMFALSGVSIAMGNADREVRSAPRDDDERRGRLRERRRALHPANLMTSE